MVGMVLRRKVPCQRFQCNVLAVFKFDRVKSVESSVCLQSQLLTHCHIGYRVPSDSWPLTTIYSSKHNSLSNDC